MPPAKVGGARRLDDVAEICRLAKRWKNCLAERLPRRGERRPRGRLFLAACPSARSLRRQPPWPPGLGAGRCQGAGKCRSSAGPAGRDLPRVCGGRHSRRGRARSDRACCACACAARSIGMQRRRRTIDEEYRGDVRRPRSLRSRLRIDGGPMPVIPSRPRPRMGSRGCASKSLKPCCASRSTCAATRRDCRSPTSSATMASAGARRNACATPSSACFRKWSRPIPANCPSAGVFVPAP